MSEHELRSGRRLLLTTIAKFASGNLVALGMTLVGGFLSARAVGPEVLGLFGSIALVAGYVPWLMLGAANGLGRELPYWMGKGDPKRVESVAATANAWALWVATACAGAMLCVGLWQLFRGRVDLACGWAAQAFMVWVLLYGMNYLRFTYRRPSDFIALSKIKITQATVNLATVAGVFLWGFYGLCIRGVLTAATNMAMLWRWRPVPVRPRWERKEFVHLIKVGFPIMFVGQLYAWWAVLNNTVLLSVLGVMGLGLNSLVMMSNAVGLIFPQAVGQVVYPQMTAEYARSGNLRSVLRIAALPAAILLPLMAAIVAAGWFATPYVIKFLLPKYTEAIPAVQWNLLTWLPLSVGSFNNVFASVGRMSLYMAAIVGGMAVYLVFLWWMLGTRKDLVVFAQSMLVGRLAFMAFSFAGIGVLLLRDQARGV